MKIQQIGTGEFGPIFEGVCGKEAVDFLIAQGKGEVRDAFYHKDIGHIDLIWGKGGENGYGLEKILHKHPEAIPRLAEVVTTSRIVDQIPDRVIMVHQESGQRTIIDLEFNYNIRNWVVTSYIPLP